MSNEINEGIIIEGGVTKVLVSASSNSFPVELPIELVNEITIEGGKKSGKYSIPTMKGLYIFIGATDNAAHQSRIKVSKTKSGLESGNCTVFYYDNGEIKNKGGDRSKGLSGKDIDRIKEFYYRNMDSINMSSNSMK